MRIGISKICTDGLYVLLAFVLRGEIGVGTIICTFALGPMIDVCDRIVSNIVSQMERKLHVVKL